jgi:molecular chaperone DnaK (HSP70)
MPAHHSALRRGAVIGMRAKAVGLDFGTTNSVIASVAEDRSVEQTKLALSDAEATTFRFADQAVSIK